MQFQPFAFMASGVSYEYVLDDYGTNALAAFSLRQLRSDYTGSAIKVRRSNDSATQDIGFVDNELDTASIATFCGSNTGYVETWYDQTTGTQYLSSNTSNTNTPTIYDGSSIVSPNNGKPGIYFGGTSDNRWLQNDSLGTAWINGQSSFNFDAYCVVTAPNGSDYHQIFRAEGSGNRFAFTFTPSGDGPKKFQILTDADAGTTSLRSSNSYVTDDDYIMSYNSSGPNAQIFSNGSQVASGSVENGTYSINKSAFGRDPDSGTEGSWLNYMQEIIFYTAQNSSSDRTSITNNLNSFYSIY